MVDHTYTIVLLIGASDFPEDPTITPIPNVKANISHFKESLINPKIIGVPEANITVSLNESKSQIERKLHDLADKTRHKKYTLLVYYSGHGMLSSEDYKLYLTTHYTNKKYLESDGINIEDFKKDIKRSAAGRKIVLLDCCHSGAIIGTMNDTASTIQAEIKGFEGTYVMTSAAEDTPSLFPVDNPDQPTYFTGKLLEIINTGIESDCEYCSLREIYNKIEADFRQAGLPRPQQSNYNTADQFYFSRNKKFEKLKAADEVAWEEADKKNNKWAYIDFRKKFPQSSFSEEAKLRLFQIEDKEYWLEASGKNTIFSLVEYLDKFSNGQFVAAANQRLEALRKKEEQAAEEQYWNQTLIANNLISFQNYLTLYPDGRFAGKCTIQIERIKKEEQKKEAEAFIRKKQEEQLAEQKRLEEQVQNLEREADRLRQLGQNGEALPLYNQVLQLQPTRPHSLQAARQCEKEIQKAAAEIKLAKEKEIKKETFPAVLPEKSENQKQKDTYKTYKKLAFGLAGLGALLGIITIWINFTGQPDDIDSKTKENAPAVTKLDFSPPLPADSAKKTPAGIHSNRSALGQADSLFEVKQYAASLFLYEANSRNLQAEQMRRIAWIYEKGATENGLNKNPLQAFQWYKKAAREGDSTAMYTVGVMYHTGEGIQKNNDSAVAWLQMAAAHGVKKANKLLLAAAKRHSSPNSAGTDSKTPVPKTTKSIGVKPALPSPATEDHVTALRLGDRDYKAGQYAAASNTYLKYPDKLNGEQCFRLGRMYQNGQGVTQNYPEARRWYQKAAEKGDKLAMSNIGDMYRYGYGVNKSRREAAKWYKRAEAK